MEPVAQSRTAVGSTAEVEHHAPPPHLTRRPVIVRTSSPFTIAPPFDRQQRSGTRGRDGPPGRRFIQDGPSEPTLVIRTRRIVSSSFNDLAEPAH
jgi:hypothetical protein